MQYNYTKGPRCHVDGQHILTIGDCTIHASSNRHLYHGYELIINISNFSYRGDELATGVRGANLVMNRFLSHLPKPQTIDPPELAITWPDGSVPKLTKDDWFRLIDDLAGIKGKVLVHCMGGHGRTGTMLAILLALTKAITKDPVRWLRKRYCEKVIETHSQFQYLKHLGIHTQCEPRPMRIENNVKYFQGSNFTQEQYDLTKKDKITEQTSVFNETKDVQPLYRCMLCCRKHIAASFYQTFQDMTGFCWACHQLTHKTNPDIQSA